MFGLRTATALSVLQKTYDESYLTCSTAVYYESQVGDMMANLIDFPNTWLID
jgi:hypothetical protein